MASLYGETTIVSYLAARDAGDVVRQARNRTTADWWDLRRHQFDLVISQAVLTESAAGDAEAGGRRMTALAGYRF